MRALVCGSQGKQRKIHHAEPIARIRLTGRAVIKVLDGSVIDFAQALDWSQLSSVKALMTLNAAWVPWPAMPCS